MMEGTGLAYENWSIWLDLSDRANGEITFLRGDTISRYRFNRKNESTLLAEETQIGN